MRSAYTMNEHSVCPIYEGKGGLCVLWWMLLFWCVMNDICHVLIHKRQNKRYANENPMRPFFVVVAFVT